MPKPAGFGCSGAAALVRVVDVAVAVAAGGRSSTFTSLILLPVSASTISLINMIAGIVFQLFFRVDRSRLFGWVGLRCGLGFRGKMDDGGWGLGDSCRCLAPFKIRPPVADPHSERLLDRVLFDGAMLAA